MKKRRWMQAKLHNRRILMRQTRSGLIKMQFKRLDDTGEVVITVPLLLSPLAMDALCSMWIKYRESITKESSDE